MAKQRLQVESGIEVQPIRPVAAPVELFHHGLGAIPSQQNAMGELAQALGAISPGLTYYAQVKSAMAGKEEYDKGVEEAMIASRDVNRQALKQAVKDGRLVPGKNPWFIKGMKEQKAKVAAMEFSGFIKEAYETAPARQSDDPALFDSFVAEKTEEFLKAQDLNGDPTFREALLPSLHQSVFNLGQQHDALRARAREDATKTALYSHVGQVSFAGGTMEEKGIYVSNLLKGHINNGLDGTEANNLVVDSVVQSALESRDPRFLELLDSVQGGSGPLSHTQYGRERVAQAAAHIREGITKGDDETHRVQKEEKDRLKREIVGRLNALYDKGDFSSPTVQQEFNNLNDVDPDEWQQQKNFNHTWMQNADDIHEDGAEVQRLTNGVALGSVTDADLEEAVQNKRLNRSTALALNKELYKERDRRSLVNIDVVNMALKGIDQKRGEWPGIADKIILDNAKAGFIREMMTWREKNPSYSDQDLMKKVSSLTEDINALYFPGETKDAKERMQSRETDPETNQETLKKNPGLLNPRVDSLFKDIGEFNKAKREYALLANNGKDARETHIYQLAAKLGMAHDINGFVAAQLELMHKRTQVKKTPTPSDDE